MKNIFEEYGKVIISVLVSLCVIVAIFGGLKLFDVLGGQMNINTDISHSDSEQALASVVNRNKPDVDVSTENLRLYKNEVFKPMTVVECKDADGKDLKTVSGAVEVTSIVLIWEKDDGFGATVQEKTEFIDYYDAENDVVILNPAHYTEAHEACFEKDGSGEGCYVTVDSDKLIAGEGYYNHPGTVVVTYRAVDEQNVTTVKTIAFAVDSPIIETTTVTTATTTTGS